MAKKARRLRRQTQNNKRGSSPEEPPKTVEEELKEEYDYVIKDLRRVFILAAVLFALLIAINLLMG